MGCAPNLKHRKCRESSETEYTQGNEPLNKNKRRITIPTVVTITSRKTIAQTSCTEVIETD